MEDHVGDLRDEPLVALGHARERRLESLLADLARRLGRIVEERDDVGALGPLLRALGDPAPEPGREAALRARVAGGAGGPDAEQDRVAVAVVADLLDRERVPRRLALVPVLLPRAAPEPRLAALARAAQRLLVHPGQHQHAPGLGVLHDRGRQLRIGHPRSFRAIFSAGSSSGRSWTIEATSAASAPASNASERWPAFPRPRRRSRARARPRRPRA